MDYQLVLQFSGKSVEDFDRLIEMEDRLEEHLEPNSEVDGHDFGSEEMNIFIYSSDPKECFERAKDILSGMTDISKMKAAYRHIESEEFTCLWPKGLNNFEVK